MAIDKRRETLEVMLDDGKAFVMFRIALMTFWLWTDPSSTAAFEYL